jgi:hypothetical protein
MDLTHQIDAKTKTALRFVLADLGHVLSFAEAPDIDLSIDAASCQVLPISTDSNRPYLTRLVLI